MSLNGWIRERSGYSRARDISEWMFVIASERAAGWWVDIPRENVGATYVIQVDREKRFLKGLGLQFGDC